MGYPDNTDGREDDAVPVNWCSRSSLASAFGSRRGARDEAALAASVQRLYDAGKETVMIELTELQIQALENMENMPPRIVNPRTKETFVLLLVHEYERLKEDDYDDSPWTREELHSLAWEAGKHVGWQDMDEYDDAQEKP